MLYIEKGPCPEEVQQKIFTIKSPKRVAGHPRGL